jgi:predicted nuclease of predicted toxin-antitoxin system
VRLLLDVNVAPRTAAHLRAHGHDVVRVPEALEPTAPDSLLVAFAIAERRVIVTQDLDFSALVALSGERGPSVVSLRLDSARLEHVNARLLDALTSTEADLARGAIVTVALPVRG